MKIAIIGGGSSYTPEVLDGFARQWQRLGLDEVVLYDIDQERVKTVADFGRRMAKAQGAKIKIKVGKALHSTVKGADFVLTQIRVGGQQARHKDIKLGLKHGLIGQETTGVGGFAKALRTIPEMLKICRAVEKHAPDSWMINFTNPSGIITEMILNHTDVKVIGLCNVPIDMQMEVAKYLGVDVKDVRFDYVGLNHLAWVRKVWVKGEDISDSVFDFLASSEGPKNIPDVDYDPWLIATLRMIPLYYCRYYYYPQRMLAELQKKKKTRAQEVMAVERELFKYYRNQKNVTKPAALEKRGGAYYSKIAVDLIDSIANDTRDEHIVNLRNDKAITDLRPNNAVEVPAIVGKKGAKPIHSSGLEPQIRGIVCAVKAYEELTVEAAMESSYAAALHALINNPIGPTADNVKPLLDELLRINKLDYK
jgi:6-phospho-beta-glucosidase